MCNDFKLLTKLPIPVTLDNVVVILAELVVVGISVVGVVITEFNITSGGLIAVSRP